MVLHSVLGGQQAPHLLKTAPKNAYLANDASSWEGR